MRNFIIEKHWPSLKNFKMTFMAPSSGKPSRIRKSLPITTSLYLTLTASSLKTVLPVSSMHTKYKRFRAFSKDPNWFLDKINFSSTSFSCQIALGRSSFSFLAAEKKILGKKVAKIASFHRD